jgi:hypothetical protein
VRQVHPADEIAAGVPVEQDPHRQLLVPLHVRRPPRVTRGTSRVEQWGCPDYWLTLCLAVLNVFEPSDTAPS